MDRSIRKSIAVNELNYILQSNNIQEAERSRLILDLFDTPETENFYLLKENIRTLKDLESVVRNILVQDNQAVGVIKIFSVLGDLIIPPELRKRLLGNEKLAFFVGAGVSKLLGIPLWNDIASLSIDYLRNNNRINHTEELRIKNEKYSSKQIMSIFHQIIRDKGKIKEFYEKHLKSNDDVTHNPYELLFEFEEALAKPVVKISTNIDCEWEKVLKDRSEKQKQKQDKTGKLLQAQSYYSETQSSGFSKDQKIDPRVLYQIHGSLNDIDNAILAASQYVKHYRDDNGLKGFLENIFKEYIVVFIGSGIQEFEILEHCIEHTPFEHYALVASQTGEDNLFRIRKAYYKDVKVNAIPYYIDFQGYERLFLIMQSWIEDIRSAKTKLFYDDIKLIDEVL